MKMNASTNIASLLLLFLLFTSLKTNLNAFSFTPLPSRAMLKPVLTAEPFVDRCHSAKIGLHLYNDDDNTVDDSFPTIYTPADRPLLAIVDAVAIIVFALIGKSSHSADGSIDVLGVLSTAFPFIGAWLVTSPMTGVYSPDERSPDTNMATSTAIKVAKGWALAIPAGIVLRGVIKGYAPPVPFIIVTLISTLVILAGVRVLFNVLENFFVEFV